MTDPTPSSFDDWREKQRRQASTLRGPSPGMVSKFMPGQGAAAGGGESGAGGLGAAGPWVGLAAAIAANETWANSQGRRPENFGDHMTDLASGKVLEYDAGALADKMPGKTGDLLKFDAAWGNPSGVLGNLKKPFEWLF